jgi:aminopeptidase N
MLTSNFMILPLMEVSMKSGEGQVDAKRRELEALRIQFDMSYIAKLAKDEASHQQNVKNLHAWEPHLKEQKRLRAVALKDRWVARDRIALLRDTFGRQATKTLREALSDLQVSLKYTPNAYSPDARDKIIEVMGWKTNQQIRATGLSKS